MAIVAKTERPGGNALFAIAVFKWIKGAALLALTFGAISMFGKDIGEVVGHWLDLARIDPENKYATMLLQRVDLVGPHQLKELTLVTGLYAAMFLVEGTGLALRQRWAEYFTLVTTGLFIPLEIYELCQHATVIRASLLIVNLGVLIFLFRLVRQKAL